MMKKNPTPRHTPAEVGSCSFGPGPLTVSYLGGELTFVEALCWEAMSCIDPCRVGGRPEVREAAYEACALAFARALVDVAPTWAEVSDVFDRVVAEHFAGLDVVARRSRVLGWVVFELEEHFGLR